MAVRKPSQRTIDIYNELVSKQNKVRRALRKMHLHAEEVTPVGRLPALVIPKSAKKINKNTFADMGSYALKKWWAKYKVAKTLFSEGIKSYLKETVFKGYKELWSGVNGIGEEPKGKFGRYSQEQILYSDNSRAMEVYNALFTHGVDFFMALLYTGKVTEFKYIYDDLMGKVEKNSYLEQQVDKIRRYFSPKARAQLMIQAKEVTGDYKHSESAKRKAKKLEKEDEED